MANALLFIACFILLACLCDQISANVIKPLFSRLRPTHHPDFMAQVLTVDNYREAGLVCLFSCCQWFWSCRISVFGLSMFDIYFCHVSVGLITCYSRIYLGVHFVTDVIGGILLGAMIGFWYSYYFYLLKNALKSFSECLHGGCCLKLGLALLCLQWALRFLLIQFLL